MSDLLPISSGGRRYGCILPNLDHPAYKVHRLDAPEGIVLPASANLSQWMGSIRNQGNEGSCTGQMGAEVRDLLYRKLFMFEKNRTVTPAQFETSASFVYKCNLIADGILGVDAGSSIHQSFLTLNQVGVCLESQEPYSDHDFSVAPTATQYADAKTYRGGAYHYLPDLPAIKSCLASGYSCGFGIQVYESFESAPLANTGYMPMPKSGEQLLGAHAQHVLGYDDNLEFPDGFKGGLFLQNSWGSDWGMSAPNRTDRGCYWMPYQYVLSNFTSDCWTMHLGRPW